MKKILFLSFVSVLLCSNVLNAKIHRLGYQGPRVAGVDYYTMQAANDSAAVGDTILVFPGTYNNGATGLTKKLTWIGCGYFITGAGSNPNLQNITGGLTFNVYVGAGSTGSTFEGLDNLNLYTSTNNNVDNLIIRRCNVYAITFTNATYKTWQIQQCFISYIQTYNAAGSIVNLNISNSYIYSAAFNAISNTLSGQFLNDVIYYGNYGNGTVNGTFVFRNSIIIATHPNDNNSTYQNCIATTSYPIPATNNDKNILYNDMQTKVFVGLGTQGTYSNDGRFVLSATSPAKGAGEGGTDCGIFGGTNKYKLSGIPPTPAFYKLTAPTTTASSNPYTITFSVRSNN
jgi:hypothetical protein